MVPPVHVIILDVILRSFIIAAVFGTLVVLSKSSEDINNMLLKIVKAVKEKM